MSLALDALAGAVRGVGIALHADRCWLYARDPATRSGVALIRWLRSEDVADVPEDVRAWGAEPAGLPDRDPLLRRALDGEPADLVDDAATAAVDHELERALGHRAFVHLNLHVDGMLWGVLQPGMTRAPRSWTEEERTALLGLRPALAPLVVAALEAGDRRPPSRRLVG
jgi:hypothetical protein